jgi:predicted dehydrogenase
VLLLIGSRVLGANDRIRTAIIGLGGRGRDHIKEIARIPGVEIAALCDVDERQSSQKAAGFASLLGRNLC